MKNNNFIKRIEYLDIAKGIAILAVIVGHSYTPGITARVIYSFHLPLFFIINGYFVKDYNVEQNFIRSAKSLLLPYFIGTNMEMVAELWTADNLRNGFMAIKVLFFDMIGGMCKSSTDLPLFHGTWDLWFLPCLFLARNVFVVLMNITDKMKCCWFVRVILFVFLSHMGQLMSIGGYYPWGMEIAFVVLPFLLCGLLFKKYNSFSNKNRYLIALICLMIWGFFLYKHFYLELAMHYYPFFPVELLEAIVASFFIIVFSQLIEKIFWLGKTIGWIGKKSIYILLIHNLEMRYINCHIFPQNNIFEKWYVQLLMRIAFIVLLTLFLNLIMNYCKGKSLKKQS